MNKLGFLITIIIFTCSFASAQKLLSGNIYDESNSPIPFAKIYVKNSSDLRTNADENGYYEMRLFPGEYFLVVTSTGYDDREAYLTINDVDIVKDVQLFTSSLIDLESVEVSAKRTNPGRDIMMRVVAKRDTINMWNYPHTVQGYIRATETIKRKEKKEKEKEKNKKKEEKENTDPSGVDDPFAKEREEAIENGMNLVEVDFTRHYGGRNKVKEIRNAYELRGRKRNLLYYTTTVKSNFDFFQNFMSLDDLHQTPVSSPISGPGILSYKYKLVDQFVEDGRKIHKIKISARNIATTTLAGYIYVVDSLWLVKKLDLTMEKGNLLVYDYFNIVQEYDHPGDSLCLLTKQTLDYGVKFKNESSNCKTVATFDNYDFNPIFNKKFFNNELAVTEQEAYDKDTAYWASARKTELTPEEKAYIMAKDSIRDYKNRAEYLDSVDAEFNRVTALKILWWGVDHRNREKRSQWTINSVAGLIRPIFIGGPRVSPGFFYFKKWKNERFIDSYSEISYGFLNRDIKGNTDVEFRYDPFHFGTLGISFSHGFDVIRGTDAITQIYKRENFIETTDLTIGNLYEVANGLYIDVDASFAERRSLDGYTFLNAIDSVIPNTDPDKFVPYQALIASATIEFTPFQKYMREPYRKVILGSKWPKFSFYYEKGIPGIFGSDVDHDYVRGSITQTFKIATLGTSKYSIIGGAFLNNKIVKDADQKFQRRSDPIWFSNPLHSFQGLDSLLPTQKFFYEAHFVHHDNGAIINKIPFMKKTGIGLVVAAGALFVPEHDWTHFELIAGLERVFKFSKRRLRVGAYGLVSFGNHTPIKPNWKISFAIMNNRNLKWNF